MATRFPPPENHLNVWKKSDESTRLVESDLSIEMNWRRCVYVGLETMTLDELSKRDPRIVK